jgi:hemoglobin
MREISAKQDVVELVDVFYGKILKDELLSPFFKHLNLEIHLPKMVQFWSFVLLDEAGYSTNVVEKHMKMPLKKTHFDQWLFLFNETIDSLFIGEKVELAKQRAFTIAWTTEHKLSN